MSKFFSEAVQYFQLDSTVVYYYADITIKIIIIFALSKLAIAVLNRVIAKVFKLYPRFKIDEKKSGTLAGILKSVIKYAVYIVM